MLIIVNVPLCFSDEMIDSTSTLVRTESVKSQQSNNTVASNDSVSCDWCECGTLIHFIPVFLSLPELTYNGCHCNPLVHCISQEIGIIS